MAIEALAQELSRLAARVEFDGQRLAAIEKFNGEILDLHASIGKLVDNLESRMKDLEAVVFPHMLPTAEAPKAQEAP